jgi:hypothetical protein
MVGVVTPRFPILWMADGNVSVLVARPAENAFGDDLTELSLSVSRPRANSDYGASVGVQTTRKTLKAVASNRRSSE